MRKALLAACMCLILILSACGGAAAEPETIEGFWMDDLGNTVSFTADEAIIDGIAYDYSIYDENNIAINFLVFAMEFRFELEKDVLRLYDHDTMEMSILYKDEAKQAEIRARIEQEQQAAAEQEAARQAEQEYNDNVFTLKESIGLIDSEITALENAIAANESYIEDNNEWIQTAEEWIADEDADIAYYNDLIAEAQRSTDSFERDQISYYESQILYSESQKEIYRADIQEYNNQIAGYQTAILSYKQEISEYENVKTQIIDELKRLGEY